MPTFYARVAGGFNGICQLADINANSLLKFPSEAVICCLLFEQESMITAKVLQRRKEAESDPNKTSSLNAFYPAEQSFLLTKTYD
jgi:hypothetical protein